MNTSFQINAEIQNSQNDTSAKRESVTSTNEDPVRDKVFEKMLKAFEQMNDLEMFAMSFGQAGLNSIENLPQIFQEIVQKVETIVETGVSKTESLSLELHPKGLGQVNIVITMQGNQLIDVSMFVEAELKKIFKDASPKLSERLSKVGIQSRVLVNDELINVVERY